MNVRLPVQLKEAGDEVFGKLGWSATRAVRALWEFASRHTAAPARVAEALLEVNEGERMQRQELLALVEKGRQIYPQFCASHSVTTTPECAKDDNYYDNLLDEYYAERYAMTEQA